MSSSLCPSYGHPYSSVYPPFPIFLPSLLRPFCSLLFLFHFLLNSLPSPLVSPLFIVSLCRCVIFFNQRGPLFLSFSPLFLFFFPGLPLLLLLIRVNVLSITSPSLTFFLLHSFLYFFHLPSLFRLLGLTSFPSPSLPSSYSRYILFLFLN